MANGNGGAVLPICLGLLASCLAGIVALELTGGMPDSGAVTLPRTSTPTPASARPAISGPERVASWADTVLARPLFSPTRRPPPVAAGPAAAPEAAAVLPRMTGVLVTPTLRRAIFAGPDGTSLVVPEGGRLGAFTVVSVRPGQAVVSGPDGQRTVSPAFDPNAPAPTTAAAAPPPPGLPGLPGFRLSGGGLGGVPGLTGPDRPPQPVPPARP